MARHTGKYMKVLIAPTSGGAAVEVSTSAWTIDMAADLFEVTQSNDLNKVRLKGLRDMQGNFTGFLNDDEETLFLAAEQDAAVRMYLYPNDSALAAKYFYGLGFINPTMNVPINGAITLNAGWTAGGSWGRNWA